MFTTLWNAIRILPPSRYRSNLRRCFVKKVFLLFFTLLLFISLLLIYSLTFPFIVRSNCKYVEEIITVSKVIVHLSKICSGDHPFSKYAKFSNKTNYFYTLLYTQKRQLSAFVLKEYVPNVFEHVLNKRSRIKTITSHLFYRISLLTLVEYSSIYEHNFVQSSFFYSETCYT